MITRAHIKPDLADSSAVVIGVGGLGCAAADVLAREGIGRLVLIDPDSVDVSNLHRQCLYGDQDLGRPKVEVAAERLRAVAPALRVEAVPVRFDATHQALLHAADVVIDGTDSVTAKFLVNDAAVTAGVPLAHAGAVDYRAQLMTVVPGVTACYRCLFEEPPPAGDVPSCQDAGILGPVVALAGSLQGAEAARIGRGQAPLFANRIVSLDAWTGTWRSVAVRTRPTCATCGTLTGAATGSHAS